MIRINLLKPKVVLPACFPLKYYARQILVDLVYNLRGWQQTDDPPWLSDPKWRAESRLSLDKSSK